MACISSARSLTGGTRSAGDAGAARACARRPRHRCPGGGGLLAAVYRHEVIDDLSRLIGGGGGAGRGAPLFPFLCSPPARETRLVPDPAGGGGAESAVPV